MRGPAGTDVVVALVSDTWTDAVRRGFYSTADQTVLSLLDDERLGRVLVADHPRGLKSQVWRRWRGDRPAPRTAVLRGTRPVSLTTPPPLGLGSLTRRYRAYDAQVRWAARRGGLVRPALVTFNLWHAALIDHRWASRAIYYAQDDESAIPGHAAHHEQTLEAYRRIGRSGMTVVTVSTTLRDRIDPVGESIVIPNGVDADLWSGPPPVSPGADRLRPSVVYAGTIDQRLDVDAIRAVAAAGYSVTLLGFVRDQAVGDALRSEPGISLPGSRSRADVVTALRQADVCLLAHRATALTTAMSPLKYAEYLASGRPVVATRLPGLEEIGSGAELVDPGSDYVAAVGRALARGPRSEADRLDLVRTLSWRQRHQPLLDLLVGTAVPADAEPLPVASRV